MKYFKMFIAVAVLGLASCEQSSSAKTETKEPAMSEGKETAITAQVVNKTDPVCGMAIMADHLGDTTTYNGSVYGFCSEKCKEDFMKDPATYAANAK